MGHLTPFERIRVVKLYNYLEVGCKYKYKVISALAKSNYGIEISDKGAYGIVKKWQSTQRLADRLRANKAKRLISNAGMLALNKALLERPCLTAGKLKKDLNLHASRQTICRALKLIGWRKVQTKYCQIVRPANRMKRFIYACLAKRFWETFDDAIDLMML